MYDIRQFKPALYVLVLIGITGFCVASQSPGLWLLATTAIGFNAWLVFTGRFAPMPRLMANSVTLLVFLFFAQRLFSHAASEILTIGQFLVFMQLVKLYEQRANRDYAQLLILSLLLMVAAAISTASLVFGILLIGYLFLSLYCCLLFHLKVETDLAKIAITVPDRPLSGETLRQDQRFLTRSMRRLTTLVAVVALAGAVLVFLFFPRGAGAGMFGQLQFRPAQTLTGFSETVQFEKVAQITQNTETVAYVEVLKNGEPLRGTETLLLRGMTLDQYTGNGSAEDGTPPWQWRRSPLYTAVVEPHPTTPNNPVDLVYPASGSGDVIKQTIRLQPTGSRVIFAVAGPTRLTITSGAGPRGEFRILYSPRDQVIQNQENIQSTLNYTVESTGVLGTGFSTEFSAAFREYARFLGSMTAPRNIDPKIREFAMRPEVSGVDAAGPLAPRRGAPGTYSPLDERIARNIETYLKNNYAYTLDLTDTKRVGNQDPMVAFLYDFKKGHCEYFAGAMTLLCQSLGIPARVVIGFKCDEYNDLIPPHGAYVVRQSHAHAWVEVLTNRGWVTFDPTSAHDVTPNARHLTLWDRARRVFDFLDYTWASAVVAYDREQRDSLIQNVENRVSNSARRGSDTLNAVNNWFSGPQFWGLSAGLISLLITGMILLMLALVALFFYERWKLRRRALRIGLEHLPPGEQLRLARQLGFYDELVRELEKRDIVRPAHLTPMEFADTLSFLPTDAHDAIHRLTNIFYRIRYGRAELDPDQHRRLLRTLDRITPALPAAKN